MPTASAQVPGKQVTCRLIGLDQRVFSVLDRVSEICKFSRKILLFMHAKLRWFPYFMTPRYSLYPSGIRKFLGLDMKKETILLYCHEKRKECLRMHVAPVYLMSPIS